MKNLRTTANLASGRIIAICALLLPATALADQPAVKESDLPPLTCELILGKHIEKLSLVDERGQGAISKRRGSSMFLWPGRYVVKEIDLQGGYSARTNPGRPADHLTLAPGKPCRFDVGTPLRPGVSAKRAGRLLKLDYRLLDADGRKYLNELRENPPRFAVYQGENKIASGSFEYG
jgi:hypothetical protein